MTFIHSSGRFLANYKNLLVSKKLFSTLVNGKQLIGWPDKVTIVEVGPRDGLQNEPKTVRTDVKINLINKLIDAGLTSLEITSFVSPKWVPQMADHKELVSELEKKEGVNYVALVPNLKGMETAVSCGVKAVAVFLAASEEFTRKNINCSIEESIIKAKEVTKVAIDNGMMVRGYISCVSGCPYEGSIDPKRVAELAKILSEINCYEVSLGDTIGVGTPGSIAKMLQEVLTKVPANKLAVHFHNTYGQALANVVVALQMGISVVDSSVGGLGGCPYAKGASGNVATEDLLYMLNGMNVSTGVDLHKVVGVASYICQHLGKLPQSLVGRALLKY